MLQSSKVRGLIRLNLSHHKEKTQEGEIDMKKPIDFESIQLTNDMMFCTVLQEPELCREFLQRVLGIEIQELTLTQAQQNMKAGVYSKGIRLDIYAKDVSGNVYDIEMQKLDTKELDLRSRYYHSEMDSHQIYEGQGYKDMKESVVIFVCDFDLFQKERSVYTFESVCREDFNIQLNDKRKTVFVNIRGKRDGVPIDLVKLLDYLQSSQPTDAYTKDLQRRVARMRDDTKWREQYMTWEMTLQERYEDGMEETLCRLIQKKLEKGKSLEQIADECEETEERVRELIEKLESSGRLKTN